MPKNKDSNAKLGASARPAEGQRARRTGEALIAVFQLSPYKEIDLEPERGPLPVREVILAGETESRAAKMTNHEMIAAAMKGLSGKTLETARIKQLISESFPEFSPGSMLPNDHSDVGNMHPCWCAGTSQRIFDREKYGQYRVR